jgi:vancomycin resistance protein VanW
MTTTALHRPGDAARATELSVPDQTRLTGLLDRTPRLTERHPALYPVAVHVNRVRRRVRWMLDDVAWARQRSTEDLPVRVRRHKSLLLRQLGDSEMYLQHNKVTNLRIAADCLDGLLIRPGDILVQHGGR